ncbi:hypothetical protein CN204_30225 [Sinorhizobium meliloti]|nr:hypothetical protein SMRU11_07670 [Sinorhizobium meliloti RU11/001]PST22618.1 hypothetical protein C7U62_21225 [Mesorhizobium loti]RVG53949.1 hypothetical protein CN222_36405 [Sinorhizobium meliloti]RVG84740.1 hypothetical protein CN221_32815 [Sinorhizobium meliloti]RVH52555.1 hypothetical protein CN213_25480 [Sinorhizobium meliloti]
MGDRVLIAWVTRSRVVMKSEWSGEIVESSPRSSTNNVQLSERSSAMLRQLCSDISTVSVVAIVMVFQAPVGG